MSTCPWLTGALLALISITSVSYAAEIPTGARTVNTIQVTTTEHTPVVERIVAIFARQVQERCGAQVTATSASLTLRLSIRPGLGAEGFTIADGAPGVIEVTGNDERGLLYGVGKFLRTSRYDQGGFTPGAWRGTTVPKMPVRGIYFATHFHNFYHDAPVDEVRRYVEEIALWGTNTLIMWYDMHHFNGWDDPQAVEFRARLRQIAEAAKSVGLEVGFGVVVNEGYGNSPSQLRADMRGMRGAMMPSDICISKPAGQEYLLHNFTQLFDWAADLHPSHVWIWPYDSGGCGCAQCQPWGNGGFLRAAQPLAGLIRQKVPGVKIILSTWFLDEKEWAGLTQAFSTRPDWVDTLLTEAGTDAFKHGAPGGLPLVGFPEISMNGMWPWGGFGANPQPTALQAYWNSVKAQLSGGFPYSEGIYEDINKALFAQLFWDPDRPVAEILKEYIAYEYSPTVTADALCVIETLDCNHHFRWWPGLLEGYAGWFPSQNAVPQPDPGAEEAYEIAKKVDAQLTPPARQAWRWRIVYLRALLDAELKRNSGRPTEACEAAFAELTRIYHAQGALVDLKPPARSGAAAPGEGVNITNIAAGATVSQANLYPAPAAHNAASTETWIPTFRPFAGATDPSHSTDTSGTSLTLLLDGVWRINPHAPEQPGAAALDAPGWADFRVPGQWANQGFNLADDATAALGTDFTIPADMAGQRLFLRFDAVHGGTQYWLNGEKLGETEYYWSPVEFEITRLARPGQVNRLRLTQTRNVFSEKIQFSGYRGQGQPPETGLPRSVRVFALPPLHVSALHLSTELDSDYRDAWLVLDLKLDHPGPEPVRGVTLGLVLTDPAGQPVPLPDQELFQLPALEAGTTPVRIGVRVANPLKWSDEKPKLYRLALTLRQDDKMLERLAGQAVGFRKIETNGCRILLNGQPIKLHGACHHELDPLTQRSGTGRLAEADVLLLKAANVNYCRTTHYPPTREFLEACDRNGIYVEVECPFMWTRFVPGEDDPAALRRFSDPTLAAVEFHRNHPSVIMWSLANESGFEPWRQDQRLPANYEATNRLVKMLDTTRLTSFHNEWDDDGRATDVGNLHYVTPPYAGSPWLTDDPRPVLLGEMYLLVGKWKQPYLDLDPGLREYWAMGNNFHWFNHMQNLGEAQRRWERENQHPCHGQNSPDAGYNQAFHADRIAGLGIWEAIGSHGLIDEWRRPKTEWWIAKRLFSPVYVPIRQIAFQTGQPSVRIPIENRYSFTDFKELTLTWELAGNGTIAIDRPATQTHPVPFSLPPLSAGAIDIPLPAGTAEGQLLILRATDRQGRLVTASGVRLGQPARAPLPQPTGGAPDLADDGHALTIRGENYAFTLDRTTGRIGPADDAPAVALREFPAVYALSHWNVEPMLTTITQLSARTGRVIESVTAEKMEQALAITLADHNEQFKGTTWLIIDWMGQCAVSYHYTYSGKPFKVGEAGLCFPLAPDCRRTTWTRESEWDVYPEDQIGRPVGKACADRTWPPAEEPSRDGYLYPVLPALSWPGAPSWPCRLDATPYGTDDFRATKYNIDEAAVLAPDGRGLRAQAQGDVHARACLEPDGVLLHLWPPAADGLLLPDGAPVQGQFSFSLPTSPQPPLM